MQRHEKVRVGETVHYVVPNPDSEQWPQQCRAAIVTRLDDMELMHVDGTSYAETTTPPRSIPWQETTTRFWVSLLVLDPDGTSHAIARAPGPHRNGVQHWHHIGDCAVVQHPDWLTVEQRSASGQYVEPDPEQPRSLDTPDTVVRAW